MNGEATVTRAAGRQWRNRHETFIQPIEALYDIWPPATANDQTAADLRATVRGIQSVIDRAIRDRTTMRAIGGGWSFSKVAVTDGLLLNTKPLNHIFPLDQAAISPAYRGDRACLVFSQCGATVGELGARLRKLGRSLRASGASNGQTIAGAISTGTHGSAFEIGAIHDSVVALHLVTGREGHVWLERATYPVVDPSLVDRLGAELIQDDELFGAALVSFGSFGVIHAAVLETDPLYLLEATRRQVPFDNALRHSIRTLTFDRLPMPNPGERPYHFEIVCNPHDPGRRPFMTVMYRRPYAGGYKAPDNQTIGAGDDALAVIGFLTDFAAGLGPIFTNSVVARGYPVYERQVGTLGEIFSNTTTRGRASSTAIGVALSDAVRALDIVLGLHDHDTEGPFPGLIGIRFVKGSSATLAFTKFAPTCVLELDGAQSKLTTTLHRKAWAALEREGIPFTLHWGKMNDYLTAPRVREMYGEDAVGRWMAARARLLEASAQPVFVNPFTHGIGLAG